MLVTKRIITAYENASGRILSKNTKACFHMETHVIEIIPLVTPMPILQTCIAQRSVIFPSHTYMSLMLYSQTSLCAYVSSL